MFITVDDIEFSIEFDKYGSLYLINKLSIFQININGNNEPIAESGDYQIIDNVNVNINKMIGSENINSYFVEDKDAFIDESDITDTIDSDELKEFIFSGSLCEIPIHDRKNGQYQALYDTFIYDNNEHLCFRTKEPHNEILYRIKIILPNRFAMRLIIADDIEYKLKYDIDKNELYFIKIQ